MQSTNPRIIILLTLIFFASVSYAGKWHEHISNLKATTNKINDLEKEIREEIELKNETKDKAIKQRAVDKILSLHTDLTSNYKKLDELESHMKYEHPEKGEVAMRPYRHMRLKTIDEMEKEMGLQGRLTSLKKKVDEKYAPFTGYQPKSNLDPKPQPEAAEPAQETTGPKKYKLVK